MFSPESKVLLCDFHREKAWVQWCRKRENGVADVQEPLLKLLRSVADSTTQEEYLTRLACLEDSVIWKENSKLRAWFSDTWLPEAKMTPGPKLQKFLDDVGPWPARIYVARETMKPKTH
ncbi:uncharacterized protein LOC144915222 [Branchiostoma floridae x Branchiostoma belcheri]